jgi:hypothetical protein
MCGARGRCGHHIAIARYALRVTWPMGYPFWHPSVVVSGIKADMPGPKHWPLQFHNHESFLTPTSFNAQEGLTTA